MEDDGQPAGRSEAEEDESSPVQQEASNSSSTPSDSDSDTDSPIADDEMIEFTDPVVENPAHIPIAGLNRAPEAERNRAPATGPDRAPVTGPDKASVTEPDRAPVTEPNRAPVTEPANATGGSQWKVAVKRSDIFRANSDWSEEEDGGIPMVRKGSDIILATGQPQSRTYYAQKIHYDNVLNKRYRIGVDVDIKEYNMAAMDQTFYGNNRHFKELRDDETGDETSSEEA